MPVSTPRGDLFFLIAALAIHLVPLSVAAWLMAETTRDLSSQIVVLAPLAAAVAIGQVLLAFAGGRTTLSGLTLKARGGWTLAAPVWLIVGVMFLGTAIDSGVRPELATAVFVTVAVALAAFNEEFTFRGAMLGVALKYIGVPFAVGISAVLFGAAHLIGQIGAYDPNIAARQFIAASLFGVALALVRVRMPALWPLIAMHAAWNLAVLSAGDVVGVADANAGGVMLRVVGIALIGGAAALALAKAIRFLGTGRRSPAPGSGGGRL